MERERITRAFLHLDPMPRNARRYVLFYSPANKYDAPFLSFIPHRYQCPYQSHLCRLQLRLPCHSHHRRYSLLSCCDASCLMRWAGQTSGRTFALRGNLWGSMSVYPHKRKSIVAVNDVIEGRLQGSSRNIPSSGSLILSSSTASSALAGSSTTSVISSRLSMPT